MHHQRPNRWRGFTLGVLGSAIGLLAMRLMQQRVGPQLRENVDLGGTEAYPDKVDLDDISVAGQHHQENETSTAAVGRLVYETLTGEEPQSQETQELLSYLVHWGYGLGQGGLYGAMRAAEPNGRGLDLLGGLMFATGLWLLGDELALPVMGLQSGPTAARPVAHVTRLGAHVAYGLTTAAVTQTLNKLL